MGGSYWVLEGELGVGWKVLEKQKSDWELLGDTG